MKLRTIITIARTADKLLIDQIIERMRHDNYKNGALELECAIEQLLMFEQAARSRTPGGFFFTCRSDDESRLGFLEASSLLPSDDPSSR